MLKFRIDLRIIPGGTPINLRLVRATQGLNPGLFFKDEMDVNWYPKSQTL